MVASRSQQDKASRRLSRILSLCITQKLMIRFDGSQVFVALSFFFFFLLFLFYFLSYDIIKSQKRTDDDQFIAPCGLSVSLVVFIGLLIGPPPSAIFFQTFSLSGVNLLFFFKKVIFSS